MDYYILNGEDCLGPFTLIQLRGHIGPDSLIKRDGEQEWQSPQNFPELQECTEHSRTIVDKPTQIPRSDAVPMPWDPRTIALAGLLFTPIWSGVMAALNEQRLKTGQSNAPSLWIAAIWLIADFVLFPWLGWGLLATWIATSVCLWLLWEISLVEQHKLFVRYPADPNPDHYGLPMLAGLPALVMLCVQAYSAATAPLSPYEVCQRFQKASVADQAAYASPKMRELLTDISRFQAAGGTLIWELSDDPKEVFQLPPDKSLVPIKMSYRFEYRQQKPYEFPAYVQLIADPKQDYMLDDLVLPLEGQTAFHSLHAHCATAFVYHSKPNNAVGTAITPPLVNTSPIRLKSTSDNKKLAPYVYPTAIAAKTALPWIGKALAVLGIGALALCKGFFSTAPKRRESA